MVYTPIEMVIDMVDINKPWIGHKVEDCACHFVHGAYIPCLVHQANLPLRVSKKLYEIGLEKIG